AEAGIGKTLPPLELGAAAGPASPLDWQNPAAALSRTGGATIKIIPRSTFRRIGGSGTGRAVSRVLFDRLRSRMVISLGWPSPTTSCSLPAAHRSRGAGGVGHTSPPIWPCSDWGLPCRPCCQCRGGLLPHRFTLTSGVAAGGGLFSVALSFAFRRPGVTWQSTR